MDKEEFNQNEINNIDEFKLFKSEFFGCPEHSRPKMESYSPKEIMDSSLPESPIEENESDGYTKKLKENVNGQNSGSESSSGDLNSSNSLGNSLGGNNGSSTLGSSSSSLGTSSSTVTTTMASVTGVGTIVMTAVVGGAALGVVPIINENYGTIKHTNYECLNYEEEGTTYQLLTFNFEGKIKAGYKGYIKNNLTNEEFEINIEESKVQVKTKIDNKSDSYTFIIRNKDDKDIFKEDIKIVEPVIDYTSFNYEPIFKTTYIEETNSLNVYFYIESNINDIYPTYQFDKVILDAETRSGETINYEAKKLDTSEFKDITKTIYVIENYKLDTLFTKVTPFLNIDNNLYGLEEPRFIEMRYGLIYPNIEGQLFSFDLYEELPTSDVKFKITHDDNEVEEFTFNKDDLTTDKTYYHTLKKYSENPKCEVSYFNVTPGYKNDDILIDELMFGSSSMPIKEEEILDNNLMNSYGNFEFLDYDVKHFKVSNHPRTFAKNVTLNFNNPLNSGYYVKKVNPVTNLEEVETLEKAITYNEVPIDVHEFKYNIYKEHGTPSLDDDLLIRNMSVTINDEFIEPPINTNYGTLNFKNYEVSTIENEGTFKQVIMNFEGELLDGFKATVLNNKTNVETELTNLNKMYKTMYNINSKELDYTFRVLNIEDDVVIYEKPIHVDELTIDQGTYFEANYKSTYNETDETFNIYFTFISDYFDNVNALPFGRLDVSLMDDITYEEYNIAPKIVGQVDGKDIYVLENVKPHLAQIVVQPYLDNNGNLYQSDFMGHFTVRNRVNLNAYFDAQLFHFALQYEDPLSDVNVDIIHDDKTTESIVIPKDELKNQNSYKKLLNGYSLNPTVNVSYIGLTDVNDTYDSIPNTLIKGSLNYPKYISKSYTNDPKNSYGTLMYDTYQVEYMPSTSDPSVMNKSITFLFKNTLNSNYYLKIVNPVTNEEVKQTIVNQLKLDWLPLDVHDFVVYVYLDNYTTTEIDDDIVRVLNINVPDVYEKPPVM